MFHSKNKIKVKFPELLFDETLSRSFESLFYIQNTGNLSDFVDEYEWYTFRDYYTMTDFLKQARWRQDVIQDSRYLPLHLSDASKGEKIMIEFFTSLDIGMWIECRLDKDSLMDCEEWRIDHRNRNQGIVADTKTLTMKNLFFKPYFILNLQFNNPNDDTYGRLIAPGKKIGGLYYYSSEVKPMCLQSIKLLSQDGETVIIRPKTRKGNCVWDNIDGCLLSFEHFLYDRRGVPKILPIGSTTLVSGNQTGNTINTCNSHSNYTAIPYRSDYNYDYSCNCNYNIDSNVWALPKKNLNDNKIDTGWAFNLNGSSIMWNVSSGWYRIKSIKEKFAVVSNYGTKQNWNWNSNKMICCNIWYYVSRILLINKQLNQANIEFNVDKRDLDCLVFNWYKRYWHFASKDNCPNWLRTQNGCNILRTKSNEARSNDIINAKCCCQISDLVLLSKNGYDRGINYDNFTNNVKNNCNVNQVPASPYIYVSDCKTFSERKKNKKGSENSGNIMNRSFDEVVIYSFFKTNYANYFTTYSGFIDDIFGIISKYYGILNMHSCSVVSCVNGSACMIGFCGSATRINVKHLILENDEIYPQIQTSDYCDRIVTMNNMNDNFDDSDCNKFYQEKWYGIDWHGYINTKSSSMAPVILQFGLLRHNDKKEEHRSKHVYDYYGFIGDERCFSGIAIGCLNDDDIGNSNYKKEKMTKWKVTCVENNYTKDMRINDDNRIKDNQILRVGDNLEMKVLFKSKSIETYFYKNNISLFETQSFLNMNMKFGGIDDGCSFEAVVKWHKPQKTNKNVYDTCASIIDDLSFRNYCIMNGAVSDPFSFQLFDYNSLNSRVINGKTKITAYYEEDEPGYSYYGMGDGWQIKIHGVYIE